MATGVQSSDIGKGKAAPLYVQRKVTNANDLIAHFKSNGMDKMVQPGDMHVTVVHSAKPVDWDLPGLSASSITAEGGDRRVKPLGDKGALVLHFDSPELEARHDAYKTLGAKWDFPSYQPHISLTYQGQDVEHGTIQPYDGPIVLGPEELQPMTDGFAGSIIEKRGKFIKIEKFDDSLGMVFGWAIVCKVNGEDYYDLNIDVNDDGTLGDPVPEHITEDAMLKSAADFAIGSRPGNVMHKGPDSGAYAFLFPMTTEIAKAMKIETKTTGLMVGYKPTPEVLAKYRDGTFTGFSIEGSRIRHEEHDYAAAA